MAGLDVDADPAVVALYPLHDHAFNKQWLRSWASKWGVTDADLTRVRNHYGEEVGFYFAFLSFYIKWLIPPTVVGIGIYWSVGPYSMAHALFNVTWSALFLIYWRRREREVRPFPFLAAPCEAVPDRVSRGSRAPKRRS